MDSVPAWLQRLGLERYVQVFAENDVDLETVRLLGWASGPRMGDPTALQLQLAPILI